MRRGNDTYGLIVRVPRELRTDAQVQMCHNMICDAAGLPHRTRRVRGLSIWRQNQHGQLSAPTLIVRVPRESSNRCTSRRLCHKHVFVMQAGLPHRTRRRPRIIHLAPKTSTDQLPIRPATQNRPKAACAPPISPASRDSPLASPPEQRRPVASTLDRLGWGKPTRRTSPGQRASPQRPRGSPRGRHHPARPPRGAQPRRCKGARAQGPRAPRPRP